MNYTLMDGHFKKKVFMFFELSVLNVL